MYNHKQSLSPRIFDGEKVDSSTQTAQNAAYTIRELFQRAEAGTLPPISRHDTYADYGILTNRFHTDLSEVSAFGEQQRAYALEQERSVTSQKQTQQSFAPAAKTVDPTPLE